MQVEEELAQFAPEKESVLTIGVFDGVHLGHRHLLDFLQRQASAGDYLAGVVTFAQHPLQVLSPQIHLLRLTTLEERIRLIHEMGIDLVIPLSFTSELAQLPARDFVTLLHKHLRMRGLVVGPDFALGKGRGGDVFKLHSLGRELGFWVEVVSPKVVDGDMASSTNIREALAEGDVATVKRFLGRPYALTGPVGRGDERGRQLGFPTANLEVNSGQALPGDGVYATRAYVGDIAFLSVTNIGTRPTFGEGERTVEVYIIGFEGGLYGEELRLELVDRLRPEKRFSGPEELKAQISQDVEQAISVLTKVDP